MPLDLPLTVFSDKNIRVHVGVCQRFFTFGRPKSVEYARGGRDLASGVTMALNITVPGRWRNSDHDLECPQKPRLTRITNFFSH
jgi:hypothetical protein